MARLTFSGVDELVREMTRMGETSGPVAEAMLDAAAAVTRDAWKEVAEEHGYHVSHNMIDSIGFPTKLVSASVLIREIYPQGRDEKGVRNAEKAFYLHYGTSRIAASYWVDEAEDRADPRAFSVMDDIWGQFVETGRVPTAAVGSASGGGVTVRTT